MDNNKFSFIASLPTIQSAMKIDGENGNARIQLDVPASEVSSILRMQILCGKIFKVTIEEIEQKENSNKVKYIK